jgi:hypothetical protein
MRASQGRSRQRAYATSSQNQATGSTIVLAGCIPVPINPMKSRSCLGLRFLSSPAPTSMPPDNIWAPSCTTDLLAVSGPSAWTIDNTYGGGVLII